MADLWATFDFVHCREALAHLRATSDLMSRFEALGALQAARVMLLACSFVGHLSCCPTLASAGDPLGRKGYVAPRPTRGQPLILSHGVRCWGPPKHGALCNHLAHLWTTSTFPECLEVLGTP